MNTHKWAEGVKRKDVLIIVAVHLLALLLGIAAGQGWVNIDLTALFVGYAALTATVLVIIRKPLLDPPPATLAVVIFTVVTPAVVGVIAHGIVFQESRAVHVTWTLDRLSHGVAAEAVVGVKNGEERLIVPVAYADPAGDQGSCPDNRVTVTMDDGPHSPDEKNFRNGDSVEFMIPEDRSSVTLSMKLHSTQNCTIVIKVPSVTLYR